MPEGNRSMDSRAIKLIVALLALGTAGYLIFRQAKSDAPVDVRELKVTFLCEDCKNVFDLTQREVQAVPGQTGQPPCPKCGKTNVSEVFRCPNCSGPIHPVGHGGMPDICPICKKHT